MSTFLTWATDVLEKVDQSAATLSDSNVAISRAAAQGRAGTEGHASDSGREDWATGYASGGDKDLAGASHGNGVRKTARDSPSHSSTSSAALPWVSPVPGTSAGSARQLEPPLDPASALYQARAPSAAMDRMWAASRALGSSQQVWQQPELHKEFMDTVRKVSEVEAKLAVLATESSRLRRSAALAAAMNAQELVNLRMEAVHAQESYGKEKNAHTATRIQSQMRNSSLQAENVAYAKALAVTQRHTEEKAQEAQRLEQQLEEMDQSNLELQEQVDSLRASLVEAQHSAAAAAPHPAHPPQSAAAEVGAGVGTNVGGAGVGGSSSEEAEIGSQSRLLERRRLELASLEARVERAKQELEAHHQNTARWPTAAQREKELERRLRSLTEQLVAKQAQAEALASECSVLQLRLDRITADRRQLPLLGAGGGGDESPKGGGGILPGAAVRQRGAKGVSEHVARAARTVNDLSLQAGRHLQRNTFLRSLTVAYVLGLHIAVFIVLSLAMAQRAMGK